MIGIINDESKSGRLAGFDSAIQGYQELFINKHELDQTIPIIESVKGALEP